MGKLGLIGNNWPSLVLPDFAHVGYAAQGARHIKLTFNWISTPCNITHFLRVFKGLTNSCGKWPNKREFTVKENIHHKHKWLFWTAAQPAHSRWLLWITFSSSSLQLLIKAHTPKPSHLSHTRMPSWWVSSDPASPPHSLPHLYLDKQQNSNRRSESSSCFPTLLKPSQAWRNFLAGNFLILANIN